MLSVFASIPHNRERKSAMLKRIEQTTADLVETLNSTLETVSELEERIEEISLQIDGQIRFSTSFGKEDQALLFAIANSENPIEIDFIDTGRHFLETLETVQATSKKYDLNINFLVPDADETAELVAQDGVLGFRESIENRKRCCEIRKLVPLRKSLSRASGWITGIRRSQAASRSNARFVEWDKSFSVIKINPLADWTDLQLESYLQTNEIPVNPLHEQGFPSIGCNTCTRAINPGEDQRSGRWWWESSEDFQGDKECGLHGRSSKEDSNRLK